jgi:acyl carrier protein
MDIFYELQELFRKVFDDSSIVITEYTSSNDIDAWDSLSHVNLILAIENHFKIRFTQKELLTFQNTSDLYHSIQSKLTLRNVA